MKIFRLAISAVDGFTGKIKLLIGVSFINALLESFTLLLLFGLLTSLAGDGTQGADYMK